ncbi:MAG: serine hydrolase domain-containing protein [Gemmatimonadaceae bacterium]
MRRLGTGICTTLLALAPHPAWSQTLSIPPQEARHFVDSIRVALSLPGLVVIVARSDGAPAIIVTGVRKFGTTDSIQATDRMHLGSNGKAITATMIGALVEQGRLTFETTLAEAFPDLAPAMRAEYRGATVRQLLGHAAGVRPYTDLREFGSFMRSTGDPAAQRLAFAARVLSEKPLFVPGTKHAYSNAGVAIAGMVAERITGRPYETLVDSLVFRPLGGRARFGNPGTDAAPQPFGHARRRGSRARVIDPRDAEYVVPAVIAAAGDASVTLTDYGKFLQMHLRGMRGIDGVLKAATIKDLHTAIAPVDSGTHYGAGWGIAVTRDGFETHGHAGSAGAYIATAAIQPARDFAVAILTNIGGDDDVLPEVSKLRPIVTRRLAPR